MATADNCMYDYDQDNGCSGGDRSPSSSDRPSRDWERERAVCALEFGLSRERSGATSEGTRAPVSCTARLRGGRMWRGVGNLIERI